MGFSSSKTKTDKSNDSKISSALQPKPFYSPYGDFSNNTYTPKESGDQASARTGSDAALSGFVSQAQPYTLEDALSGPYYQMLLGENNRQLDYQRQQDEKALNDRLSASNQLGGSYDAYNRSLMRNDYTRAGQTAQVSAVQNALGALGDTATNNANVASILSGINQQQYNRYYQPLAMAQGYQQSVSPLQVALASHYSQQGLNNRTTTTPWGPVLADMTAKAAAAFFGR